VIAQINKLAIIDVTLRQLLEGGVPTVAPPTQPPTQPPSGSASEQPTSPTPTSPPTSSGLVNHGFEDGVGPPWELVLAGTGAATISQDRLVHIEGGASARVDITAAGDERAAIAVRQGGLGIQAGSRYIASVSVRAASTREVRIRIASATGDTYGTRVLLVGPEWQVLSVDVTVFTTDSNAYIEFDLGRFSATTWLDDASFIQAPTTSG
jgi:hypothetical protein